MAYKQLLISDKQAEVLLFIVRHVERFGYQPSQDEIADSLGITRRAIFDRLTRLEEKGYLTLSGTDRAIRLLQMKFKAEAIE